MIEPNVWDLIKLGRFEEACQAADPEFAKNGRIGPLRNKIFALLHLSEYDECICLSRKIISLDKHSADHDSIFLGVAYWLQSRHDFAVEAWRMGLDAQYTDAAGGVGIPLILRFASI